jgi:hypothetical protein
VPSGTWAPTANLSDARANSSAAPLTDGRILIACGDGASGPLATAEFFNTNGSVSPAAPMDVARSKHISVVLQDGRVLVAGGKVAGGGATNAVEIYDPAANSWTSLAGGMIVARSGATAALLQDQRVFIVGGDNSGVVDSTGELFDPAAGTFSFAGTLSSPRTQHAMALLPDGRVLIVNGFNGSAVLATSDIFDPVAGAITPGPSLAVARFGHSATTLMNGQVLIAGGNNGQSDLASAEIFDPAAGTPVASTELFTPWQGIFSGSGSLITARSNAVGSAMQQDGLLLVAGGTDATGTSLASTELYGFATVKTDQSDYTPGQTVTITGSGWQPGETVTLSLVEVPLIDTHGPFTTVADANGNILDTQFAVNAADRGVRFYLNATGSVSQAQTTFTDANLQVNSATLNGASSVTVAANATIAAVVNVTTQNNAIWGSTGWRISTAPGSFTCVNTTDTSGSDGTFNESLNIPAPAAAGTYNVYFAAYTSNVCGGTASNTLLMPNAVTVTATVNTTTTVTSSTNPSGYGTSVTFTANVARASGGGTPSGTVTFKDGAATLGTGTLANCTPNVAGNQCATFTNSAAPWLSATTHSITAVYGGDSNFSGSTSSTLSQVVNKRAITVTAATNTKTYDRTTSATGVPTITSGSLATGDSVTWSETYDTKDVGTSKTLTPAGTVSDGNGGANYAMTFVPNTTGVINKRPITVTAVTNTKTYDGTTSAVGVPTITTGSLAAGDSVTWTETYNTATVGTASKTLIPTATAVTTTT